VRGGGTIFYRGLAIEVKDAIAVEPQLDPFDVGSDAYGAVDRRKNNSYLQAQFTPVGAVSPDALDVLLPLRRFRPGQFNTPVLTVSEVDDTTLTLGAGHGVRVGDALIAGAGGGAPALLRVTASDNNTVTVDAAPPAGDALKVQVQSALVLWTHDGARLTVHNAALSGMPDLSLSAGETFWGQVTVEGYRRADTDTPAAGDGLLYRVENLPFPGSPAINPADIPTVPYTVSFQPAGGGAAQGFVLRDPLKVSFDLQSDEVNTDAEGLVARAISNLTASATLRPVNRDAFALLDAVTSQNAPRGASLPAGTLTISGPGNVPTLALYGAQLTAVPLSITTGDDRVGEITFQTRRVIGSDVFYAGMTLPPA
jgi:hypothetical protein